MYDYEKIKYIENQRKIYDGAMKFLRRDDSSDYYYNLAVEVGREMAIKRRCEMLDEKYSSLLKTIREIAPAEIVKKIYDKEGLIYHEE